MFAPKIIALLFAFTSVAFAQDVDYDDLPSQCKSVCDPVVRLTQQCDQGNSGDDQLQCVCQATNATVELPACEACFAMYDSDGHDNDVHDLLTKCSFTTTSYVPSATNSGNQTMPITSGTSGAPASMNTGSTTSAGTEMSSSQTMTSSGSSAENTGAAAAIGVDGMLGVLVGVAGAAGYL